MPVYTHQSIMLIIIVFSSIKCKLPLYITVLGEERKRVECGVWRPISVCCPTNTSIFHVSARLTKWCYTNWSVVREIEWYAFHAPLRVSTLGWDVFVSLLFRRWLSRDRLRDFRGSTPFRVPRQWHGVVVSTPLRLWNITSLLKCDSTWPSERRHRFQRVAGCGSELSQEDSEKARPRSRLL